MQLLTLTYQFRIELQEQHQLASVECSLRRRSSVICEIGQLAWLLLKQAVRLHFEFLASLVHLEVPG